MRTTILFAVLSVAASGCYTDRTVGIRMGDSRRKPPSDVVLGADAVAAWARLTPEDRKAASAAMKRASGEKGQQLGPVAIAIAQAPLPNNAAVMVVREPGPTGERLLVLAADSLDSRTLSLAIQALSDDEELTPAVRGRRLLGVSVDGRVREASGKVSYRLRHPPDTEGDVTSIEVMRLLDLASSARITDLPGVGRVKLFRFD